MAGGIFVVPLLTLAVDVPFSTAVAVSLISVIACSCASSPQFLSAGLTNLRLAVVLEVATTFGVLVGVFMVGAVPDSILYGIFAAVLLVSAIQMILGRTPRDSRFTPRSPSYQSWGGTFTEHAATVITYQA